MALPATDSFTNDNGTALESHGDWTINEGSFEIQSNACQATDSTYALAHWDADTFADDQYAEATIDTLSSYYRIGVGARAHASASTGYMYVGGENGAGKRLYKLVAGAPSTVASAAVDLSVSDLVRIECEGTTITPILNGSTDSDLGAQTDSSISSGSAGVGGYNNGSRVDDWEGGDLTGSSPSASPSASESASPSLSESVSESVSPSLSESASESVSPSPSESASPSLSESASESVSESASPSPGPTGDVCWGHVTGVLEDNVLPFNGNWTGTGTIENPGANDNERLALDAGEYMISEMVNTGVITCELLQNEYAVGDDVTLEYRDGATAAACNAAAWGAYAAPFESLGYVQIRVTSTL